ncbi:MAG: glycoside hydrolase family 2 TIM barrel-domain containing protein [Sedimentisphaerales bacterium]|nr:glycoside hydrolase family 2 TIM barrel-domain containing protein [Sedimentisphaerales bacterium]
MLNKHFLAGMLVTLSFVLHSASSEETKMMYLSGMDKDTPVQWEFYCTEGRNSGEWTTIQVPSNWELQGFGTYNYGQDAKKGREQGKYRYRFKVPNEWAGKVINIVFEGVMTDTDVWINGKSVGPKHQGGFYRFKYDITELVKFGGLNLLEVTVSKVSANASVEAAERYADYWIFGGIYRQVYLEAFPKQFIKRTAIDARADGNITVDVYLENIATTNKVVAVVTGVSTGGTFSKQVVKGQSKITLSSKIAGIKPWNAETPNLYKLELQLLAGDKVIHKTEERFGFRTFEVRPGNGLFLNGRKIRLKGVNRHSFWPDSGRCLSREISYDDVRLIKEMNMNAVRMSHYPPDVHFLEVCDEVGLYVLDELGGWQKPPFDTEIGRKLVREMVTRDVSQPCILFWDNGNEGGWNRELDDQFELYDPQKRRVLHPWENFNGIDTQHYRNYENVKKKLNGSTLFMPTEFLHGLYDGGHGAGLNDYWNLMHKSPVGAGGFLWVLVDEGVVRTDQNGKIDTDGNHAPDGILGPYRQKEGSFYAIKEIWSPIHIDLEKLPMDFSGQIQVENRYDFTNLSECRFEWKLARLPQPFTKQNKHIVLYSDTLGACDVKAGGKGVLKLDLPEDWSKAEVLYLTAFDPAGKEVWTWSWGIQKESESGYLQKESKKNSHVRLTESKEELLVKVDGLKLSFSKKTGELAKVEKNGKTISVGNWPQPIMGENKLVELNHWRKNENILIDVTYEKGLDYAKWTVYPSGWVRLDYQYVLDGKFDLMGITFDYPENKMIKMKWVGKGPYRVWKNRTKGGRLDFWSNDYKNHTPGMTWNYPEFRGYYRDWHWVTFETKEGEITLLNGTEDVFLGVYRPKDGFDPRSTNINVPGTGISLLHGIPAIGTKFNKAQDLGPESQKNEASGKYRGSVYFYFEAEP